MKQQRHLYMYRYFTFISIFLVVLAVCIPMAATAQQWKLFDVNISSGLQTELDWPKSGAQLFFRNPLVGYYYTFNEIDQDILTYYKTTDGGKTWTKLSAPDPIPHRMVTDQFGISQSGFSSNNAGNTWQKIRPNFSDTNYFDDPTLVYSITSAVASSPTHMAFLFQLYDYEDAAQDSLPYGPSRLTYTTDGGSSWKFVDTMTVFGKVFQELYDSTAFGYFPAPTNMLDTISIGWWKLLLMPDDSTLYVGTKAYGYLSNGDGLPENRYYLGKVNLNDSTVSWSLLPFSEPLFPPPAFELDFSFLNRNVAYAVQARFVDLSQSDSAEFTIWRTQNAGIKWDSMPGPAWLDYRTLKFVTPMYGVAVNGYTVDGGKTWTKWAHMFGNDAIFYPVDSSNYALANRYSLVARSTDAGRSWEHNESGAIPQVVSASNGRVLVGRNYHSLLISADSGETWVDAGAEGNVPERMSAVWAFSYPDPVMMPERVLGVASFIDFDGATRVSQIVSTDGGATWAESVRLPELEQSTGTIAMKFIGNPEDDETPATGFIASSAGLLTSTDLGATWTLHSQQSLHDIDMFDPFTGLGVDDNAIYVTTDGGENWRKAQDISAAQLRYMGGRVLDSKSYRVLFSDHTTGNTDWVRYYADDRQGMNWNSRALKTGADLPLDGSAFWVDTMHVYAVGRTATIQHSVDGGVTFVTEHPGNDEFKALAGYIVAGQDDKYLYVFGPGNVAGRFRTVDKPISSVPIPVTGNIRELALLGNPVTAGQATLQYSVSTRSNVRVEAYDILGNQVYMEELGSMEAGAYQMRVDVSSFESGRYTIRLATGTGTQHVPMVILR